ncbi:MAG: helix-turn-helix transcriptional regulator [Clostridia bacterium]|nr:helix-turn-helix transcriptional regulator [Clostridia bacterium]
MDQMKTGKFIARMRKAQGYTQRQLADMLGISDKTVSKWETGNGLPEVSCMLPLCDALRINVNELLTGERLTDADYKNKAEENMMDLIKEKAENKKKMRLTVVTGVIATVAFLTLIIVVAVYTDVISAPIKVLLVGIACAIFAAGIYVAMQGERTIGYYQCRNCGELFVPSFAAYTMGAHMLTTRRLKCPHCKKTTWCKKVLARERQE